MIGYLAKYETMKKAKKSKTVTEPADYAARAKILKALSHPARLMIVDVLRNGPQGVCAIHAKVGTDLSTVSRHLSVLRHAGIVADERRGVQVLCRLRCPCVVEFFDCTAKLLRAQKTR
jgi:ArsR family transcriptional regulator